MSQNGKVYQESQQHGIPAKGGTRTPGAESGTTEVQRLVRLLQDVLHSTGKNRTAYAKLEKCGKQRDPTAPGDSRGQLF